MKNTDCINGDRSMAYEREFTKPYPSGWENIPSHNTPVTAEIMDDYDDAIEHIEDFLNGSTAIFPIQATGGMTQPVGIDENGRLVTMPGGGTAESVTYDNTESELESTDVQGAIDELASGAGGSTAATTTYDNSESGLEAENCQDAIDELSQRGFGKAKYKWTKLLDVRNESSQTANSYSLSDSIYNYDTIMVQGYHLSSNKYCVIEGSIPAKTIVSGGEDNLIYQITDHNNSFSVYFDDDGETIKKYDGSNYIFAVYGGKVNGGSSDGSGLTKLWEYENSPAGAISGNIDLSDAYTNYDFLIFSSVRSNSSLQSNGVISTEDLAISQSASSLITIAGAAGAYGVIGVTDVTHLAISTVSNDYGFRAVYGYKSGGSSRTETELISAPIDLTTIGMSIALSDSIKNYDELILKCSPSNATAYNLETRFALSDFVYGSTSNIYLTNEYHYDNGTGWFGFHPDSTGDNLIVDTANYCILQNAIGVKY